MSTIRIRIEWGNSFPLRKSWEFYLLSGGVPIGFVHIYRLIAWKLYDLELWLRRRRYNRKKRSRKRGPS